jgi:hypothetical protein
VNGREPFLPIARVRHREREKSATKAGVRALSPGRLVWNGLPRESGTMRATTLFAMAMAALLALGCSDDDDTSPAADAGKDAGGKSSGGEHPAGGTGGSQGGASGTSSAGHDSGTGEGPDADGGGASGSGTDAGSSADGGMPGTSGSMDSGTGDAGTPPVAGCAGLMSCCAQLKKPERMSCELLTMNADDATCDQLQAFYCMPASVDAGAASCTELDQCCQTLPKGPVRVACATTSSAGVALDCQQVMGVYCPAGGDPNACTTLTTCCESLPPPRRASCDAVVQAGLPSACESTEAALCP